MRELRQQNSAVKKELKEQEGRLEIFESEIKWNNIEAVEDKEGGAVVDDVLKLEANVDLNDEVN